MNEDEEGEVGCPVAHEPHGPIATHVEIQRAPRFMRCSIASLPRRLRHYRSWTS